MIHDWTYINIGMLVTGGLLLLREMTQHWKLTQRRRRPRKGE